MMGPEPVGIFAHKKCNGRNPRRNHTPPDLPPILIAPNGVKRCRMRRQASPSDHAREAQLIEMRRIVVGDSAGKHKAFPSACWNFKTLQLPDHLERSVLSAH